MYCKSAASQTFHFCTEAPMALTSFFAHGAVHPLVCAATNRELVIAILLSPSLHSLITPATCGT